MSPRPSWSLFRLRIGTVPYVETIARLDAGAYSQEAAWAHHQMFYLSGEADGDRIMLMGSDGTLDIRTVKHATIVQYA